MKIIITLITSFLLLACPGDDFDPDISLTLRNNSDIDIVEVSFSATDRDSLIEDSLFDRPEILDASIVRKNSERSGLAESSVLKEEGLRFAFVSLEVVETVPWDQIREENLVLKTFDLTLEELEAMEYTLAYP